MPLLLNRLLNENNLQFDCKIQSGFRDVENLRGVRTQELVQPFAKEPIKHETNCMVDWILIRWPLSIFACIAFVQRI